ncbi:Hsp70 family protein [Streptacidiphilus sp. EB129]|uniref:Hsp70 family protein n=1 Tax=Streptacidiphilus sp. EB129 TaxID=3156262 RepID=UPI0035126902
MSDAVLAIDFGTSASSAAVVADGTVQPILEPTGRTWSWPSAVYLDGETLLVGTPAERHKRVHPGNYRSEFKRDLGQETPIRLGDRAFTPTELATGVLRALKLEAEKVHGRGPITRTVLTVPTSYGGPHDPRWQRMIEAGEAAGFRSVELIFEPVAAALEAPAGNPFQRGDLVLVYDFGGGTFDAALVRIGAHGQYEEVLGHRTLDDCGGTDIDAAVLQWLIQNGSDELSALLDARGPDGTQDRLAALRARIELSTLGTQLKHQLSERPSAVELFDRMLELTLDRGTFNKLAEPFVARTVRCCAELLAEAEVPSESLAAVLLVGGSSRMPLVGSALTAEFDRPVRSAGEREYAVLRGAARFAGTAPDRYLTQDPDDPGEQAVRWTVPGGTADLLVWHVPVGREYPAGADLAEVRLTSGAILGLRARVSGTVRAQHVRPGDRVHSGDWLLTAARGFQPWRTGLNQLLGPPAVLDEAGSGTATGSVYVCGRSGRVDARVAATGAPRWRRDLGVELTVAPAAADGRVYAGRRDGRLFALDAATGAPRWRRPYQAGDEVATTPVLADGLLCFGSKDRNLHVLDCATGELRKRLPLHSPVRSVAWAAGTALVTVTTDGRLTTVDALSGRVLWSTPVTVLGTPLVVDGMVIGCFTDGTLRALDCAAEGRQLWSVAFGGAERAREPRFSVGVLARDIAARAFGTPPLLACDSIATGSALVHLAATDGSLTSFDLRDGAESRRLRVAGSAGRGLAARGGVVYLGSTDQHLYAVDPWSENGPAEAPTVRSYRTGGEIHSAPVPVGPAVHVISADGFLHALDAYTLQGPGPSHPGDNGGGSDA